MKTCTKPMPLTNVSLPCPRCGEQESGISVRLCWLDGDAFQCLECEAEFGVEEVEAIVAKWTKILTWVRSVPRFEEARFEEE